MFVELENDPVPFLSKKYAQNLTKSPSFKCLHCISILIVVNLLKLETILLLHNGLFVYLN